MKTPNQVRHDASDVLQLWLPFYLAEADRADGLVGGTTPTPQTWVMPASAQDLSQQQLPRVALALVTAAVSAKAGRDDVRWELEVHSWVRGSDYDDTGDQVGRYAAAIATCLRQRLDPELTCRITELEFAGDINQRTLATSVVVAQVDLDNVWEHTDPYDLDEPPDDLTVQPQIGVVDDVTVNRFEEMSWPEP